MVGGLGILLLAFLSLIYYPGLSGPFLLDDWVHIPKTYLNSFNWSSFINIIEKSQTGLLGRPISIASFSLNYIIFGKSFFYFKLVNLIIHIINGIAFYFLISQLLKCINIENKFLTAVAFITVTIWLFHPIQVSTVLYTVQRMTLLSTLGLLVGLNCYLYGRLKQHLSLILLSLIVFFPFSFFSKENGILMPLFILIIEYFFIPLPLKKSIKFIAIIIGLLPLFGMAFFVFYHFSNYDTAYLIQGVTPFTRTLTEINILFQYAEWIYWPQLSHLGLFHDDITVLKLSDIKAILSLAGFLIVIATLFILRRRQLIFAFGLSWFLIAHLLESTFLPLELAFEHRNYVASFGLILILIYYTLLFFNKRNHFKLGLIACLIIFFYFSTLTAKRVLNWSELNQFYSISLTHHPYSERANLAWSTQLIQNGRIQEAIELLKYTKTLAPHKLHADLQLLLLHCQLDNLPHPIFEAVFKGLAFKPITAYTLTALDLLIDNKRYQHCPTLSTTQIVMLTEQALKNKQIDSHSRWLALLYQLHGRSLLLNKKEALAIKYFNQSFHTYPKRIDPLIDKLTLFLNARNIRESENTLLEIQSELAKNPRLKLNLTPYYEALEIIKLT